ncbi:Uncharacterized protein OS=Xanthomonas arboricola pv. pruni MAFF 301420 GN=XPR_4412 PE=4 SV=1 [Gemmata massiliana]|uniref:DUF4064 domain-containing protein n=1 Tax=Gemmata massiliana TaxID=1210884 RepID=A0A6P2DJM8_9BACT|nr:hypothetical protein [Gemmata massiliana]VTS03441.1 Uncharacterized protein OS=Xanthomonas arboricola pv. pruni MAFF 301420 GN=XPR_4412 PE=4 SV=1 [Gemmata massiliana]
MTRTDRDHLRVLSICHYVLAGLCFVAGCFPIIHLVVGIMIVNNEFGPPPQQANAPGPPPEIFGWLFIGVAATMIASFWALAVGLIVAGRCLSRRKSRTFCMVMAGAACLFQPLGTALGVFTFIVLARPSVREAFEPAREAPEPNEFDRYHSE